MESAMEALPGAAKLLLQQGAPVNTLNEAGQTVLHMLFRYGSNHTVTQIVQTLDCYLAQPTLNILAEDMDGKFPLICAVKLASGKLVRVLSKLKDRRVWLEQKNRKSGETALDYTIRKDNLVSANILVQFGAGFRMNVDNTLVFIGRYQNIPTFIIPLENRNAELVYRISLRKILT